MTTARLRNPGGRPGKHGARSLARVLRGNELDARTAVARDFYAAQDALADDRGGWSNVTAAERMLIEVSAAELLIVRAMFAWAARQPSIITETAEGPRLLGPLAKGFTSHAGALTRALGALGIRPDKVDRLGTVCGKCGGSFGDLQSYLHHQPCTTPAVDANKVPTAPVRPPAGAAAVVDGQASTAAATPHPELTP